MVEFTALNSTGKDVGETQTLDRGQSDALKLAGDSHRRRRRITFDFSGVVASTLKRDEFTVNANPEQVRPFEGERGKLSDLLEMGQEIVYMLRMPKSASARATDNDIVGVRVVRRSPSV